MTHTFRWRQTKYGPLNAQLSDRFGHLCRVLARSAPRFGMIAVEFEDGYRVVTSRYAVRRA